MRIRSMFLITVGFCLVAVLMMLPACTAQTPANGTTSASAGEPLVWIDPANPYANYLEAAVLKKHTPVEFTTIKANAKYVATLEGTDRKGSSVRAIFLGPANSGSKSALSVTITDANTGIVIFAYTCHKSGSRNRGFQSAAECIAKHWSHFIEHGKP